MDYTSMSARVWVEELENIKKAAKKHGFESYAEYVRQRLRPIVAKDLGIPAPTYPPFEWKKTGPLQQVAAATGVSKKQIERAWTAKLTEIVMNNPQVLTDLMRAAQKDEEEPPSDRSARQTRSNIEGLAPPKGAPIVRRRKAH